MADDDDRFTDALEVYEDAPSTSQSSHAQVMAGIDEDSAGISENWGDRSTSSHSNQTLTPQNKKSYNTGVQRSSMNEVRTKTYIYTYFLLYMDYWLGT